MSEKARGGRREREERRDKCEGLTTLAKGCANASANRLDTLYASIRHFPLCARKHEGEGEGVKEGEKNERDKLPLTCVCVTYSIHTHTQTVVKLWYDVCIMCFLVINGIITMCNHSVLHLTWATQVVVAEWLRRWTRNPLGSPRAGSNPADNESFGGILPMTTMLLRVMWPHHNIQT